jgi:hypothetical protein
MTVTTNGFVLTSSKDVIKISLLAINALNELIKNDRRKKFGDVLTNLSDVRAAYSAVDCRLLSESEMVQLTFKFRGDQRTMNMHFSCDSDHEEYGPKSISLSMGCSGYSDVFIQTVMHALSLLGPVYFDSNDSDDIDPALLDIKKPTLLQAVELGYVNPFRVDEWVDYLKDANAIMGVDEKSFEIFFGESTENYLEIIKINDFAKRVSMVKEFASKQPVIDLPFMSALVDEPTCAV